MPNKSLYIDSQDQLWHLRYIKILAQELGRPVQEITPLYEDVLMQLKEQAKIENYLAIFTSRRVRTIFNNVSHRTATMDVQTGGMISSSRSR